MKCKAMRAFAGAEFAFGKTFFLSVATPPFWENFSLFGCHSTLSDGPLPDLGPPLQLLLRPGDVVLVHSSTGHGGGPHLGSFLLTPTACASAHPASFMFFPFFHMDRAVG